MYKIGSLRLSLGTWFLWAGLGLRRPSCNIDSNWRCPSSKWMMDSCRFILAVNCCTWHRQRWTALRFLLYSYLNWFAFLTVYSYSNFYVCDLLRSCGAPLRCAGLWREARDEIEARSVRWQESRIFPHLGDENCEQKEQGIYEYGLVCLSPSMIMRLGQV